MTVSQLKRFLNDKEDCRTVYYDNDIMDITKIGLGCEHFEKENIKKQRELFD